MYDKQDRGHSARLRRWFAAVLLGFLALSAVLPISPVRAEAAPLTVLAAASLKTVLDEISAGWQQQGGGAVTAVYGASPALARQVEGGFIADIFISADRDWMDYLAHRNLIRTASRINLLGNRIVLIAPAGSTLTATIAPGFPLARLLGDGRLATANVDAVPAGKYGRAALVHLGVWDQVKDKLAQAENVRAALMLVARGEALLGIVYATDAAADPSVKVLDTFPEASHPPIVYPAAVLAASTHPRAATFLANLRAPAAVDVFRRAGFTVLAP